MESCQWRSEILQQDRQQRRRRANSICPESITLFHARIIYDGFKKFGFKQFTDEFIEKVKTEMPRLEDLADQCMNQTASKVQPLMMMHAKVTMQRALQ
jgi:hypothetical protein